MGTVGSAVEARQAESAKVPHKIRQSEKPLGSNRPNNPLNLIDHGLSELNGIFILSNFAVYHTQRNIRFA
jgi:hypothetical protein